MNERTDAYDPEESADNTGNSERCNAWISGQPDPWVSTYTFCGRGATRRSYARYRPIAHREESSEGLIFIFDECDLSAFDHDDDVW